MKRIVSVVILLLFKVLEYDIIKKNVINIDEI